MTDAIGATPPATYTPVAPTSAIDRPDQMGKDTFLKLLVAQLKYQDPSNPASNTEVMAQTAAFSQVEKLEQLLTQNASIATSQAAMTAGAMVGQYVTYTATDGAQISGTVNSVRFDVGGSTLLVDGKEVPMGALVQVSQQPEAPATPEPAPAP